MPYKILVVDDEPDLETLILQRFRKRIRAQELSFVFAGNGHDALTEIERESDLDVVLTDINMPGMDGLTLLTRLKESHPMLRSVIVSAYGDMQNIRTALNRGAFDFVTKPIDFTDLEITLDKAIGESVHRKQAAQNRDRLICIDRELNVAREIQESFIPRRFPVSPQFEVYGTMIPASHVGGDLFDFFQIPNSNQLAFMLGDVSGKGIPAALFMAVSRALLRIAASKNAMPHECMDEVSRFLSFENTSMMYLTCFCGILDLDTGEMRYSSAAHNPPYLLRANAGDGSSALESLTGAGGLPLGLFEFATYETTRVQLQPGDSVVVYTDGVTEATNRQQTWYGDERLVSVLSKYSAATSVADIVRGVVTDAKEFADGAPASDDMTVLGVRYLGKQ